KPYSHHHKSETNLYKNIDYRQYYKLADELKALSSESFDVIFRLHTMKKLADTDRGYCRCLAIPFWSYVDAGGGLWACSAYLGDERFYLGNIMEKGFEEVWKSGKRKEAMRFINEELDVAGCRQNCRMDEINRYLWNLKNPPGHVNFI
ncbi:MAG: SPASM domain-containing protein, partial [Deltaproteobacteria bacterium]|nr:SPASM domain-containing protein [Deltaproteobacteria bacterium]